MRAWWDHCHNRCIPDTLTGRDLLGQWTVTLEAAARQKVRGHQPRFQCISLGVQRATRALVLLCLFVAGESMMNCSISIYFSIGWCRFHHTSLTGGGKQNFRSPTRKRGVPCPCHRWGDPKFDRWGNLCATWPYDWSGGQVQVFFFQCRNFDNMNPLLIEEFLRIFWFLLADLRQHEWPGERTMKKIFVKFFSPDHSGLDTSLEIPRMPQLFSDKSWFVSAMSNGVWCLVELLKWFKF